MKKILTHLTGIVFLITILIACGSSPADDNVPQVLTDSNVQIRFDTVTIHLMKAFEEDGKKHLKMYDSNHPDIIVDDTLETLVKPKTVVIWMLDDDCDIRKLKKISPKDSNGSIMDGDASGFFYTLFTGKKKFKVPNDATPGTEKYDIKFKYKDNSIWTIDPYLKIPN